jgi:hypothetical protein
MLEALQLKRNHAQRSPETAFHVLPFSSISCADSRLIKALPAGRPGKIFLSPLPPDEGAFRFENSEDEHQACRSRKARAVFPAGADFMLRLPFHAWFALARPHSGGLKRTYHEHSRGARERLMLCAAWVRDLCFSSRAGISFSAKPSPINRDPAMADEQASNANRRCGGKSKTFSRTVPVPTRSFRSNSHRRRLGYRTRTWRSSVEGLVLADPAPAPPYVKGAVRLHECPDGCLALGRAASIATARLQMS